MKYVFVVFAIYNAAFIILILVYWLLKDTKGITEPYLTHLWISFAAYCILDKLDDLKNK